MAPTPARTLMWRSRSADWWAGAWRWVLMATGAVVCVYVLLEQDSATGPVMAAAIAVLVVGAAVTSSKPMAIALMAMPALFVVERIGIGTGLSVSDAALAAAFGTAVLLGQRPYNRPMTALLWLNGVYQFSTLFTVIVNPYAANTIEWFHAWLLISGALVTGWALGHAGYARLAFTLMIASACVIAAGVIVAGAVSYSAGNFSEVYPSFPFPMQKNAAGTMMAFAALVAYVRPAWAGLPVGWMRLAFWILLAATAMTQSRQAIIGLIVAILITVARRGVTGWRRLALLLVVPAVWLTVTTITDQVNSQNRFNSLFQRLDWFREVYLVWRESPVFGQGLRYWYVNTNAPYQPPQGELEVLASAGIVGLAGFAVMWLGIIVVLWRVDPRFGTLALAVTVSRLVQGQFDLFWVTGQVSIPFVIAGVCLGAMALDTERTAKRAGAALERGDQPPQLTGSSRPAPTS